VSRVKLVTKNTYTPGERITMKKTLLPASLLTLFLVNPIIATAASNDKYPAANFSPSVIYLDNDVTLSETTTTFDPKYPAATFQPTVVYADNDLIQQTEQKFDPNYPAAYFKPKIIYP